MHICIVYFGGIISEWIRLLKQFFTTGQWPFYSWSKFLGTDFYSSSTFYVTGDIFVPLLMLFKDIDKGLLVETIILIYISAFAFRYFLIQFGLKKPSTIMIVSFVYALNGLVGLYLGNYMFHRFYAFLPLLFAGVELYIIQKKYILFVITVSILFLQSFYFMYPISLFLIIYMFFTFKYKDISWKTKEFWNTSIQLIIFYLIGFGLVAFLMIPSISYSLNTPRLNNVEITHLTWPLKVILGMVVSFLSGPFPIMLSTPNIYQVGLNGHEYWYSFYTSSVFIALFISFLFFQKDKKKFLFLSILLMILTIILFLPINHVFHGFAEPTLRLTIIFTFFFLLTIAYILDNVKIKKILPAISFYLFFVLASLSISYLLGFIILEVHLNHLLFILFTGIVSFLFILIYKNNRLALFIFIIIEITFNLSVYVNSANQSFYKYPDNLIQDYIDYYQDTNTDLISRTYIDITHFLPSTTLNLNQSLVYKYLSTSSYDSFYEPALVHFLEINGINNHIISFNNPELLKMLGVKYYLVEDPSEIPENVSEKYISKINYLNLYEDLEALSIGFTYSQFKTFEEGNNNDWTNIALVSDETLPLLNEIQTSERALFSVSEKYANGLKGNISLVNSQLLFFSIPYNKGWKILDNSNEVDYLNINGGFIGLILNEGYHEITMFYTPRYFKISVIISILSALIMGLFTLKNKINTILLCRWKVK